MKRLSLSLGFAVLACGCGDSEEEAQPVSISFNAVVGAEAAACGQMYSGLGTTNADAQLADARLFLSDIELKDGDGLWQTLVLDQEPVWQDQGLALLDFENGSAGCADSGTTQMNNQITGTAVGSDFTAFRATVGVPFDRNHGNSAAAPAPLDTPGMFWTWRGGHKFVRVDFMAAGARWNVHLGSTACDSSDPTAPPTVDCGRPNRPRFMVDNVNLDAPIVVDLAELVAGSDIQTNTSSTPPGCMSNPMEPNDCTPVFSTLGLDFASGQCNGDCAGQKVFNQQ